MALTIDQLSITTDDSELHAAHQQIGGLKSELFQTQRAANYWHDQAQQLEWENSRLKFLLARSEQRNSYAAAALQSPLPALPQG